MKKLFKVKIETEIMVMSKDAKEAVYTAIKSVVKTPDEIESFGKGQAYPVNNLSEIPENWKGCIPYCPEGALQETNKCCDIVINLQKNADKGLDDNEVKEIIRIKNESKQPESEVVSKTRPDPKPKDLDWKETKSGRSANNPFLRFKF